MKTHTPGPWQIGGGRMSAAHERKVVRGANLEYVARVDGANESAENMRLIAAAPELLEACRRLLTFNQELCQDLSVSTHYPSADFARAAIAKAEGQP